MRKQVLIPSLALCLLGSAETLPPDVVTVAQERGRKLDLWQTAAELLEELNINVS